MAQIADTQILFLNNLIYLELYDFDSNTLIEIIDLILEDKEKYIPGSPALVTKEEWVDLLESFAYEKDENGNYITDSNGNKVIKEENRYFLENYVVENYTTSDTDENGKFTRPAWS